MDSPLLYHYRFTVERQMYICMRRFSLNLSRTGGMASDSSSPFWKAFLLSPSAFEHPRSSSTSVSPESQEDIPLSRRLSLSRVATPACLLHCQLAMHTLSRVLWLVSMTARWYPCPAVLPSGSRTGLRACRALPASPSLARSCFSRFHDGFSPEKFSATYSSVCTRSA